MREGAYWLSHFFLITTRWHHWHGMPGFLPRIRREGFESLPAVGVVYRGWGLGADSLLYLFPIWSREFCKLDVYKAGNEAHDEFISISSDNFYCFSFFLSVPVVPSETGNLFLTVTLCSCILLL